MFGIWGLNVKQARSNSVRYITISSMVSTGMLCILHRKPRSLALWPSLPSGLVTSHSTPDWRPAICTPRSHSAFCVAAASKYATFTRYAVEYVARARKGPVGLAVGFAAVLIVVTRSAAEHTCRYAHFCFDSYGKRGWFALLLSTTIGGGFKVGLLARRLDTGTQCAAFADHKRHLSIR